MIKQALIKHLHKYVETNSLNLFCNDFGVYDMAGCYVFAINEITLKYWPNPKTRSGEIQIDLKDPGLCKNLEELCLVYHNASTKTINKC